MVHELTRHPDTPCAAIERIEVEMGEDGRGALRLRYVMMGDAARVVALPSLSGKRQRRDELWRHTCCELFVRDAEGDGYSEYNFAPGGDWAAYRFDRYREGGAPLEAAAPNVLLERSPRVLALTVTLLDQRLEALRARRVGLACIVETRSEVSCWALAHAPGRPDFHHSAAFALMPGLAHTHALPG